MNNQTNLANSLLTYSLLFVPCGTWGNNNISLFVPILRCLAPCEVFLTDLDRPGFMVSVVQGMATGIRAWFILSTRPLESLATTNLWIRSKSILARPFLVPGWEVDSFPSFPYPLPHSNVVMPSSTRCLKTYLRLLVSFPSPPSIPRSTIVMHPSTRCLKTCTLVYLSHFRRWNVNTR